MTKWYKRLLSLTGHEKAMNWVLIFVITWILQVHLESYIKKVLL
jgi:hypothetical protein